MSRWQISVLGIAAVLVACAVDDSVERAAARQAIHGGEVVAEGADPAVGLLEFASGNFGSGTLISPRVVLTAGHVAGGNIQGFFLGSGTPIRRGVDTTASSAMRKIAIAEKRQHPSYECKTDCEAWKGWNLDMALIVLAEPITDVAPVRFGGAPEKGAICRTVGFGDFVADWDAADGAPFVKQKRTATSTVTTVRKYVFETSWLTGVADSGDSGGPIYCDVGGAPNLVGTVAYHTDGEGAQHVDEWYARTDVAMPWIEEQLRGLGETWPPPQNVEAPVPSEDAGGELDAGAIEPSAPNRETDEGGGCSTSKRLPASNVIPWVLLSLGLAARRKNRRHAEPRTEPRSFAPTP